MWQGDVPLERNYCNLQLFIFSAPNELMKNFSGKMSKPSCLAKLESLHATVLEIDQTRFLEKSISRKS